MIPPSWASFQETIQIVWIRPRSYITITKQLDESWREAAEVAKQWKNWLELGENFSSIKFKPTRANSSQVGGQMIPNSIEVVKLTRVGLSCEDHLARALQCSLSVRHFIDTLLLVCLSFGFLCSSLYTHYFWLKYFSLLFKSMSSYWTLSQKQLQWVL